MTDSPLHRKWLPGLVWGLTGLLVLGYFLGMAFKGWIPHDEGTLGNSAERVLQGMVPHTDFMDTYTGGLSYLHALAFKVFGIKIWSMRVTLLVFSLVAVFAAAFIFRSFLRPLPAALLTLLSAVWMTPMYFAGLSSWYVTFFAVFSLACFFRYNRTGTRAFLLLAGILAGFSFLIKITGLYLVCALVATIVFTPAVDVGPAAERGGSNPILRIARLFAAVGIVALLVLLLWEPLPPGKLLLFLLPGSAVCVTGVIWELERKDGHGTIKSLIGELGLLGVGFVVPILAFVLALYDLQGLKDLYVGLFVLPASRLEFSFLGPPDVREYAYVIPYGILLGATVFAPAKAAPKSVLLLVFLALAVLLSLGHQAPVYAAIWASLRAMIPVTVLFSCLALLRFKDRPAKARRHLFAATAALAFFSLTQFPVTHGIYFCYVSVFLILALAALSRFVGMRFGSMHLAVGVFFLLFAVMWESQNPAYNLGTRFAPVSETYELQNVRGGIKVNRGEGELYDFIAAFIVERSEGDTYILAGPDCPEIYFLAGKQNPMPFEYDFFYEGDDKSLLRRIDDLGINLAVVNLLPDFSYPYSAGFTAALEIRFPRSRTISKYRIMWRE